MNNFRPIKDELDMTTRELYFKDLKKKLKDPNNIKKQQENKLKKSLEALKKKFNKEK